jgi:hypothetical protein
MSLSAYPSYMSIYKFSNSFDFSHLIDCIKKYKKSFDNYLKSKQSLYLLKTKDILNYEYNQGQLMI